MTRRIPLTLASPAQEPDSPAVFAIHMFSLGLLALSIGAMIGLLMFGGN